LTFFVYALLSVLYFIPQIRFLFICDNKRFLFIYRRIFLDGTNNFVPYMRTVLGTNKLKKERVLWTSSFCMKNKL